MSMKSTLCGLVILCIVQIAAYAQTPDIASDKSITFPSGLLDKLGARTGDLNQLLTQQTEKYLAKMQRREQKMQKKLGSVDSNAAKQLFAGSAQQYAALKNKIQSDTGSSKMPLSGTYAPYLDSLKGALGFLQKNAGLISEGADAKLQSATSQFQALQAKMADADQAKAFIQQRKQLISQYISQHANLQGLLGKQYAGMNQDVYYYSQQLRQYKDMWNNPDQLEQKALALLNNLPAFQTFMKNNSQLAGLFHLPGNYASTEALAGLQTKDQIAQQIQGQVSAAGSGGAAALQANLESAGSQLDSYKDKLSKLGSGSGDIDMPDFKPNEQKTKTFWKRLEYGTNFQTTRDNYYFPTVTDLGGSVGYKINSSSTVGIGASYKIGWGNGIQHIALSSQGAGLRSFIDIKIKGSLSLTGGLEYNYVTPFRSVQQLRQWSNWTKSGLIGVTKTVSVKSRMFKSTKLSLLWDVLSYQQIPKTQPILFRIGYSFN